MSDVEPHECAKAAFQGAEFDSKGPRKEYIFKPPAALDRLLSKMVNDTRDMPLVYLFFDICCTSFPAALLLLVFPVNHIIGAGYMVATFVLYLQRFMLALHYSQHRPLFKKDLNWLNGIAPNVLCTMFGVPSGMYNLHHCVMHHVEANSAAGDASSTERYQRDSFLHFLCYWLRFALGTWVELPMYGLRQKRYRQLMQCVAGQALYLSAAAATAARSFPAALWVFVLPYALGTLALAFGNWSQHALLDPAEPHNAWRYTYNAVCCPDNSRTFNDGYHVLHHLNSRLHWSSFPSSFQQLLPEMDRRDCLVFKGIGFFDVGLALMLGRLNWLANHVVPCGPIQASRSRQQLVELLQYRLQPTWAT